MFFRKRDQIPAVAAQAVLPGKGIRKMLQPITKKNTVDIAIDNIGEYIIRHLHVGDVLPGEREISGKLRISRNITREALQHYRTLGIIESKPKVGATVARLTPEKAYRGYFPFLSIMEHSFRDLAQLRLMLELGCAEAAVARVTEQDIADLETLCRKIRERFQQVMDGEEEVRRTVSDLDFEFHSRIMRLSGNTLIESLIPLVLEFFSSQLQRHTQGESVQTRAVGYREHFEMVDALERRDLAALQSVIRSHIHGYIAAAGKEVRI